jgi:hypothetical protein
MSNSLESDRQWLRNLVAAIEASTAGSTELPIPDIHSLLPRLTQPMHSRRLPLRLDDCSHSTSDALVVRDTSLRWDFAMTISLKAKRLFE